MCLLEFSQALRFSLSPLSLSLSLTLSLSLSFSLSLSLFLALSLSLSLCRWWAARHKAQKEGPAALQALL